MQKRVFFAITFAVLLFIYTLYSAFFAPDESSELRGMGKAIVDRFSEQITERAAIELENLFHVLDANKDGVLQLDEFQDRRVAIAAAMFAARRQLQSTFDPFPDGVKFPTTTRAQIFAFFFGWFQLQMMFLLMFLAYENILYMVTNYKPMWIKTDDSYLNAKPPKVDVKTALMYNTPPTLYEKAKMAFFILSGIAFTRMIMFGICFFVALVFINLSVLGGRSRKKNPTWFNFWESGVQLCSHLLMFSVGFYCIRIYGAPAKPSEVKLLVGNHVCVLEVVILFIQAHMPSFVSRIENLSIPGFRGLATATNSIMVNRDAAASRTQTLDAIRSRAGDAEAEQLMLFPEGTCDFQRALFMFKKGAFEPGEPVQMACFAFPYKHFNMAWSGRAAGGNDFGDLFLRMCCQFVNRCEVRFLPVYYPSEEEKKSPELYADHCQQMIAHVIGLPVSDAQFKDYKTLEQAYAARKNENQRFTYVDSGAFSQESKTGEDKRNE